MGAGKESTPSGVQSIWDVLDEIQNLMRKVEGFQKERSNLKRSHVATNA